LTGFLQGGQGERCEHNESELTFDEHFRSIERVGTLVLG